MNDIKDPIAPFRSRLLGLAYRMLGSRTEAEDVLQDAYLRFHDATDIANREAYLVTTVTRLCIDRLKSAQVRREAYVGPWLPEPVFDVEALSPQTTLELAEDLSFALMLVLDRLSPMERAAFLLHDIFDMEFAKVAAVLGKSEAACRQLASRARRAVKARRPTKPIPMERQTALLVAFASAVSNDDLAALMTLLREDAVLLSDGGGIKLTALNAIVGADRIARFVIGTKRKFAGRGLALRHDARTVNGALGVITYLGDDVEQVMSLCMDREGVAAIYIVRNPKKLTHLAARSSE